MASEKAALRLSVVAPLLLVMIATGCSSAAKKSTRKGADDPAQDEVATLKGEVTSLNAKITSLENKLASVTEQLELTRTTSINAMGAKPARTTPVTGSAADGRGVPVEAAESAGDPEAGFVNDSAVMSYRQAMILLNTRKYAEAILAFTSFLERYADHALAGSAQFYIGEAYYRQKEYKLALQEFSRVLTSYDRSPHVPETLSRMAEIEEGMKRTDDAAKHRQLLASLFPSSPAAGAALSHRLQDQTPAPKAAPAAGSPSASQTSQAPASNPGAPADVAAVPPPPSAKTAQAPAETMAPGSQVDEPPATAPLPKENP